MVWCATSSPTRADMPTAESIIPLSSRRVSPDAPNRLEAEIKARSIVVSNDFVAMSTFTDRVWALTSKVQGTFVEATRRT